MLDVQGESLGPERLAGLVQTYGYQTADEIRDALLGQLANFRRGGQQADDVTLLVVRQKELSAIPEANPMATAAALSTNIPVCQE